VGVIAKIDDINHELAKKALEVDPENVVGLEMEVPALAARQLYLWAIGRPVRHLMIKGVADYAGEDIDEEESKTLQDIPEIGRHLLHPHPTENKDLKAALQAEATVMALRVALQLLKVFPDDLESGSLSRSTTPQTLRSERVKG
jgi:hypothetical protein